MCVLGIYILFVCIFRFIQNCFITSTVACRANMMFHLFEVNLHFSVFHLHGVTRCMDEDEI